MAGSLAFSDETKAHLRKFRLTTSRAKGPQAVIYTIDRNNYEIKQDDDQTTYTSLEDLGEDLPDNQSRYVLLSYPVNLEDGRLKVPYVMLFYMPPTCKPELRMMYASAKEDMRNESGVGECFDIESVDDLEDIPGKLLKL